MAGFGVSESLDEAIYTRDVFELCNVFLAHFLQEDQYELCKQELAHFLQGPELRMKIKIKMKLRMKIIIIMLSDARKTSQREIAIIEKFTK